MINLCLLICVTYGKLKKKLFCLSLGLPTLPISTVYSASSKWQTIYMPFFGLTPYLHMARTWTITSSQSFSVLTIDVSFYVRKQILDVNFYVT